MSTVAWVAESLPGGACQSLVDRLQARSRYLETPRWAAQALNFCSDSNISPPQERPAVNVSDSFFGRPMSPEDWFSGVGQRVGDITPIVDSILIIYSTGILTMTRARSLEIARPTAQIRGNVISENTSNLR